MSLVGRYTGETCYCKHAVWTHDPLGLNEHIMVCFFHLVKTSIDLTSFLTGSNYIATLTLGSAGAHASYYHKANEQVTC